MALDELTLIGADNDGNDTDFASWSKLQDLIRAVNAGQMQSFRNRIINGDFRIWQRGTSFSTPASGAYAADRWRVLYDGTIGAFTLSRQAFALGQTDVPGEPAYYLRWDHTSAGSGSTFRVIQQPIEDVRTYAGRAVALTFYAKADTPRSVTAALYQDFGSGGSPSTRVTVAVTPLSLTTAWQKFTIVTTMPSIAGKTLGTNNNHSVLVEFVLPVNTTMTIDFSRVQFEPVNATAQKTSPFEERPIGVELSLCRRYCRKSFLEATAPAQNVGVNTGEFTFPALQAGATNQRAHVRFEPGMRAAPTITLYNPAAANAQARDKTASGDCTSTAAANASENGFDLTATGNASTAIAGALCVHYLATAEL
ncbi:MAG: carbohydrate-binding protein CenC [Alphaproteobacteria bacterium]|nr:carbohydrate-binding protein CenC [Alphaproteobacteria bacterium]